MLIPTLVLALSGLSLPAELGTLSPNDHTQELLTEFELPEPPKSDFERRFSLELRVGIAAPTGGLGVAAEFGFVPRFGLGCGVGSNAYGAEYACWLRLRPILGRHRAMTVSSGVSTAPFVQDDLSSGGLFGFGTGAMASIREGGGPPDRDWAHADWLNTDLGYELRQGDFLFRAFGGVAVLLNPSAGVLQPSSLPDPAPPEGPLSVLIYAGLGVGFSE